MPATNDDDKECKIKTLADILRVSVRTIKNWEKKEHIPTPRRNKWGWRVYNKEEKECIITMVKENNYFREAA